MLPSLIQKDWCCRCSARDAVHRNRSLKHTASSRRSPVAATRPTPSARGVFLHLRHPMAPAYRTTLFSKLHEA